MARNPNNPAHKRLLDDKQHALARKLYLGAMMKPKEIAVALNEKFGTNFNAEQISDYAYLREWTKKRKADEERIAIMIEQRKVRVNATRQLESTHKDFLDASARVGAKILTKAETLVERATNGRDLSSAASAARTGTEIYRKAVGLESDEPSTIVNRGLIAINYATGDESPFSKVAKEMKQAVTVDAELVDQVQAVADGN